MLDVLLVEATNQWQEHEQKTFGHLSHALNCNWTLYVGGNVENGRLCLPELAVYCGVVGFH